MSFELCKRVSLNKKNNIIKVSVASSNVFPKTYETCELCKGNKFDFDRKLLQLFYDLQTGSIQISTINKNTEDIEYAMCKVREWLKKNNLKSYEDLFEKKYKVYHRLLNKKLGIDSNNYNKYSKWKQQTNMSEEEIRKLENEYYDMAIEKVYSKPFKVFKKALYEKFEGNYKIVFDKYYEVAKFGKYNRGYNKFSYTNLGKGLKTSYKKAYILKSDMSDENLEIVKVKEGV